MNSIRNFDGLWVKMGSGLNGNYVTSVEEQSDRVSTHCSSIQATVVAVARDSGVLFVTLKFTGTNYYAPLPLWSVFPFPPCATAAKRA